MRRVLMMGVLMIIASLPAQAASVCIKGICVHVDVVSTPKDLERGLQGREGLGPHEGMLFVFDQEGYHRFWMKDMKFSIDMLWLNSHRQIVTIASSCPACNQTNCEVYSPVKAASYVLEVPAGFSLSHQLKEGDTFEFKGIH